VPRPASKPLSGRSPTREGEELRIVKTKIEVPEREGQWFTFVLSASFFDHFRGAQ
jgi:hypothetical protein